MLQGEHSAIFSTFIKLPSAIKIFVLSILDRFHCILISQPKHVVGNQNNHLNETVVLSTQINWYTFKLSMMGKKKKIQFYNQRVAI